MKPFLPLVDRTILLTGRWNTLTQMLLTEISQLGGSVGLVSPTHPFIHRYLTQLNDDRAANDGLGRVAHVPCDFLSTTEMTDAVLKVAEALGSPDSFIHTYWNYAKVESFSEAGAKCAQISEANINFASTLFNACLPFQKARNRGRSLFALNNTPNNLDNLANLTSNGAVHALAMGFAELTKNIPVAVNVVQMPASEDYLEAMYPNGSTIEERYHAHLEVDPCASPSDPNRVAELLGLLLNNKARLVTGQTLTV